MCYVLYSQPSRTVMDSNKSTALFEIPRLSAQQGGLWECRVSTNGGQDSCKFILTVKGLCVWVPTTQKKICSFSTIYCMEAHRITAAKIWIFEDILQSPLCPLLLPNCWNKGVSSCWWGRLKVTKETAPSSPPGSSTSLWRMETLGPPSEVNRQRHMDQWCNLISLYHREQH